MSIKDRHQQPDNIFSIIPIEVFMDDRLTKTDLRVLGAIMSWRNKDTNLMWPKREQISKRCNLPICKISTATTHLVGLGWLKKEGVGGCSRAAQYQFLVPDLSPKTVTDSVTVTKPVTVTNSVTKTVTESVTKTVTDSVRGIKQTNEQTNEHKNINTKGKGNPDIFLLNSFGIDGQLAKDFLKIRKAKDAPITETAMDGIRREAGKAGILLVEAIRICVERNWQGFNANWDWKPRQPQQSYPSKQQKPSRMSLEGINYREGVNEDGSF